MQHKKDLANTLLNNQPATDRILIIDDEPLIRRALADYLSEYGYETTTASDGHQGLSKARVEEFSIVLVDLRMPHVDGLKVITTLKEEQPNLPIIVVSGTGVLSDAIEAIRQGAWDYITKPIQDMDEVAVVIEQALERVHLRQERDRYQQELEQLNRSLEAEVARQVSHLQTQNRELAALNRVSEAISAPLDLDTMLKRAIDAAIAAIGANGGAVRLLNPSTGELVTAAVQGLPDAYINATQTTWVGEGLLGHVAQEGTTHICQEFPDDPFVIALRKAGFEGCIGIPLRAGEKADKEQTTIGTLGLVLKEARTFDTHELEFLTTIGNQIGVAVARIQNANDLKQANIQLGLLLAQIQEQAELVQQIIDTVPEGVLLLDLSGQIILANPVAAQNLSVLSTSNIGDTLTYLGDCSLTELLVTPPQGLWHEVSLKNQRFEVIARSIETHPTPGWVLVIRDVTREREIEGHIHQQERLAAVGQLAAGIAHDFNNLLTVITGYSELLLHRYVDKDEPEYKDIEQIHKAGERASVLTRKLLVFSRQQVIQPQIIDINNTITDINEMLRRLISEDIELVVSLDPALKRVKADLGQIEQIIINLAVNAGDAMPGGGTLSIETANINLDREQTEQLINLEPGPYVMLTISDTGVGMDSETLTHVFEPFFTTKAQGKGTGLGLATVYGIVQQSQGDITVSSQPQEGTTFTIYLPQVEETTEAAKQSQISSELQHGTETILLVEDEDMVRELARYALEEEGYQVLPASYGMEALKISKEHQGAIDLLLTDVVMPGGMSGRDLADALGTTRPETKILFMSGYTDDAIVRHNVLTPDIAFLQKPFTPSDLAQKVREILDS